MKLAAQAVLEAIQFKRFGVSILPALRAFGGYGASLAAAKMLSMAAQIGLGRYLGPDGYGRFTVVLILANYFALPMIGGWGLAYVHHVSGGCNRKRIEESLKMMLLLSAAATSSFSLLLLVLQGPLSNLISVSDAVIQLAVIVAVGTAIWTFAKMVFQSTQHWRSYSFVELLWAAFFALGVGLLVVSGKRDIALVCIILTAAYILSATPALVPTVQSLGSRISFRAGKKILHHGGFLLLNSMVATLAFGLDRLIIHAYLGAFEVGIYQAHFLATYGVMATLTSIVLNFLFPLFSKVGVDEGFDGKIRALVAISYPAVFVLSLMTGMGLLRLYGYDISFALLGVLSVFNCVQFHGQVVAWRLASHGAAATARLLWAQGSMLGVNVAVLILLIDRLGMLSGALSLLAGSVAFLAFALRVHLRPRMCL